jgi:TM2 domain-containing membrane protein YozV
MTNDTSSDTRQMMIYDTQKKSVVLAYLFWFFLGALGVHRFYMRRIKSGIAMVVLVLISPLLVLFLFPFIGGGGFMVWVVLGIWVIVDAFLIPGWVRAHNMGLIENLTGEPETASTGSAHS